MPHHDAAAALELNEFLVLSQILALASANRGINSAASRNGGLAICGAVPCLSADLTTHAVPHFILHAVKMGRRVRRDRLRGAVMSKVSGDALRGFGKMSDDAETSHRSEGPGPYGRC